MSNLYNESWQLYKARSESFNDGFEYYLHFTKGFKTLELFAGYGRLTNYLYANGLEIETVELEPNLGKFIKISQDKNHIINVLDFNPTITFERICAGYNSFCLLTKEEDIKKFFTNLNYWLTKGGLVSLSYYHPDAWHLQNGITEKFEFDNIVAKHITKNDLSKRNETKGLWADEYIYGSEHEIHSYSTKIYESIESLIPYLIGTNLELKDAILNYNRKKFPTLAGLSSY